MQGLAAWDDSRSTASRQPPGPFLEPGNRAGFRRGRCQAGKGRGGAEVGKVWQGGVTRQLQLLTNSRAPS